MLSAFLLLLPPVDPALASLLAHKCLPFGTIAGGVRSAEQRLEAGTAAFS
jgi:hypothetical protein